MKHVSSLFLKKIFAPTCAVVALSVALPLFAQSLDSSPAPVQYTVTPESPAPNTRVLIEVAGVGSFLGDSTITWSRDGKTVLSGTGASRYSFTTGNPGTETEVVVSIQSSQYGLISRTFDFNPSTVDLIWEADTTVPPMYPGKALMSPGSDVRVVAFPSVFSGGKRLGTSDLSFQWKLNDEVQPDASGLNRSAFSFTGNQLHQGEVVSVDVFRGGTRFAHGEIAIPTFAPLLLFYAKDPLRGVLYDTALEGSAALPGQEAILHAEPYFFSRQSLAAGTLQYVWALNGQEVTGPDSARGELTLRQTGSGSGSADLSAELQNTDDSKLLQGARASLTIFFGSSNPFSSLFGI